MKLKSLFPLYLLMVLTIPGAMIYGHEAVLRNGEPFLFKTRPVDPSDLFRGRYVALAFEQDKIDYQGPEHFEAKDKVYAVLGKDAKGFASIESLTRVKPKQGNYLKVRVAWHETSRWVYDEKTKQGENITVNTVHLILPFNRFYMNEKKAPQVEAAHRKSTENSHARIRVLNGSGVIESLEVDGKIY